MSDSIEIKIDGPKLTPDAFKKAVDAFFALIDGVARNVTGKPDSVKWVVEVCEGSAIVRVKVDRDQGLALDAPSQTAETVIDAVTRGVRSLKAGIQSTPAWFTKDEIRAARVLASIADGKAVHSVAIKNGDAPDEFSPGMVQTADAILAGEKSFAYGSIEGKLDALADREAFTCSIYEPNYKRSVPCSFNKKELEDEAYKAFRKRVLISGLIRYGKEGYPTSVAADQIRVFPEESELPTVEEIQAIYKEISQ